MTPIDVYRIWSWSRDRHRRYPHYVWRHRHPDRWLRGWQVEWPECSRALRAWTKAGARRRGLRGYERDAVKAAASA